MESYYSYKNVIKFLPSNLGNLFDNVPAEIMLKVEEIRLRFNCPLIISGSCEEYFIGKNGGVVTDVGSSYFVNREDVFNALQLISNYSLYSVEDQIRNGYITIDGGHRVGIAGEVITEDRKIKNIKNISFINYRIARQIIGASDKSIRYIIDKQNYVYNTLIISPPQCGKTTLLRDIVRQLSNGISNLDFKGRKIALIDERSEIAACIGGKPKNDIGIRTDVLDGCPKAEGIIMMVRSMSPDIIATDEIGRDEDGRAVLDAVNAGVKVITTIHGQSEKDFLNKTSLKDLHHNTFERIIILSRRNGVGTIEKILDGDYKSIKLPNDVWRVNNVS